MRRAARGRELRFAAGVLGRIRDQAESGYPEEVCGGLLGDAREGAVRVIDAVPLSNARDDERRRRYLIGPDAVLGLERRAESAGLQVVGYYHSHPDAPAEPSEFDRAHAWPWYVYLIVGVQSGRAGPVRAWRLAESRDRFESISFREPSAGGEC